MPKYMPRAEWPDYLREKHGLKFSKNTFTKMATTGGGPEYVKFGQRCYSTPEMMDAWVEAKLSAPRHSTSEIEAEAESHVQAA